MSDPVFRSKLRDDLKAFILQKRASGYPYHTSAKVLSYLDTMIAEDYPDCSTLSKEICDAWIRKCSVLHQNTLLRRVTPVRQFAKYLVGTGKSAYIIPSRIPRKQIRYDAHIFTEAELKAFFTSIDACKKSPFSPLRCYVIPVIFRLIYTCGLRASEARLLRTDDIDLSTGKIFIRKSKGWEARIVFVSNDMLDLLSYAKELHKVDPSFPEGLHCHVFRHSIGMAMFKAGIPLPYIKDFLGHSSIDSTSIYAHADNETMAAALRSVDQEALPVKDSDGNVVSHPEKKWKGKEEYLLHFCGLD